MERSLERQPERAQAREGPQRLRGDAERRRSPNQAAPQVDYVHASNGRKAAAEREVEVLRNDMMHRVSQLQLQVQQMQEEKQRELDEKEALKEDNARLLRRLCELSHELAAKRDSDEQEHSPPPQRSRRSMSPANGVATNPLPQQSPPLPPPPLASARGEPVTVAVTQQGFGHDGAHCAVPDSLLASSRHQRGRSDGLAPCAVPPIAHYSSMAAAAPLASSNGGLTLVDTGSHSSSTNTALSGGAPAQPMSPLSLGHGQSTVVPTQGALAAGRPPVAAQRCPAAQFSLTRSCVGTGASASAARAVLASLGGAGGAGGHVNGSAPIRSRSLTAQGGVSAGAAEGATASVTVCTSAAATCTSAPGCSSQQLSPPRRPLAPSGTVNAPPIAGKLAGGASAVPSTFPAGAPCRASAPVSQQGAGVGIGSRPCAPGTVAAIATASAEMGSRQRYTLGHGPGGSARGSSPGHSATAAAKASVSPRASGRAPWG